MINKFIDAIWMLVAILEFLIIIYLIVFKSRKGVDSKLKKDVMENDVDFNNLINSAFNSDKIWDQLRKKCHPDRFGGDEKKTKIAGEIQAEINKNKNNVKVLQELKLRAENELGIKI
jgi:hypothetical protein